MQPLVSIVMPTYNHAHCIGRALQSVIDQTYTHWEVLVVDNHSTDNTEQVIQNFKDPRIKHLKIHNHGIIAASRNLGIQQATGIWVAFLDSDDWWKSTKLEISMNYLQQGADLVYHSLWMVRKTGKVAWRKTSTRDLSSPVINDLLINGNAIANSSVVVRRDLLLEIGCLDENPQIIACEDFDAWLRIAQRTERFRRIPNCLGYYWCGGGNVSMKDMSKPNQILLEKHAHVLSKAQQEQAFINLAYKRGQYLYKRGDVQLSLKSFLISKNSTKKRLKLKSWLMILQARAKAFAK